MFDEILQELETYQKKTIDRHNKNRTDEPRFTTGDKFYHRISGIPNKRKSKFKEQIVKHDRKKTVVDTRNIKLHKSKLKRKRKL